MGIPILVKKTSLRVQAGIPILLSYHYHEIPINTSKMTSLHSEGENFYIGKIIFTLNSSQADINLTEKTQEKRSDWYLIMDILVLFIQAQW